MTGRPIDHRRVARIHAIRFRIWQFCQAREWNVTAAEIAEGIDETSQRVGAVVKAAGWSNRLRPTARRVNTAPGPAAQGLDPDRAVAHMTTDDGMFFT